MCPVEINWGNCLISLGFGGESEAHVSLVKSCNSIWYLDFLMLTISHRKKITLYTCHLSEVPSIGYWIIDCGGSLTGKETHLCLAITRQVFLGNMPFFV